MNKRIERLFAQALDLAVPETYTTLDSTQLTRLKDKFAELIVRECAHVALMSNGNNLHVCELIKKHFGVEE